MVKLLVLRLILIRIFLSTLILLRERINFFDLTHVKDFDELNKLLNFDKGGLQATVIVLELPEFDPPKRLPTDFSGFKARGLDFTTCL
jgi:hypothetical protein